jgi:hypothetical protein
LEYRQLKKKGERRARFAKLMQNKAKNGLAMLIKNSSFSYAQVGKSIATEANWLNNDYYYCKDRISKLVHGTNPTCEEKKALAKLFFHDADRWRDLYFYNDASTYLFMCSVFFDEISKQTYNYSQLKKLADNYSKISARQNISNPKMPVKKLVERMFIILYFRADDEVRIGIRKKRRNIPNYAREWFNEIKPNSPLVKELTPKLREALSLNHANRKKLKQIMFCQLISAL